MANRIALVDDDQNIIASVSVMLDGFSAAEPFVERFFEMPLDLAFVSDAPSESVGVTSCVWPSGSTIGALK